MEIRFGLKQRRKTEVLSMGVHAHSYLDWSRYPTSSGFTHRFELTMSMRLENP
jgi:hypothetical protein